MTLRWPARSLAVCALAAGTLIAAAPARATAAPPAITFGSETCDLGNVVQGELPDCVFSFSNGGDDDLRIFQVEPTCGCTTALLSAPLLRAGERGGIRVVFDSDNFAGEVVKEVAVRSNDPDRRSVTLRVKALVEPEIDFEPRVVTFDAVPDGAVLKQAVILTNRRADPVRVLRVEAQPASYRCLVPAWSDRSQPLVLESWDRVAIDVVFTPPETLAMAIAGECALEVEGPRKRHYKLKLLAFPSP
ncbi:MAG: DUF1573 domain-containing protein [Candidatus Methylomirabilia bacterium]